MASGYKEHPGEPSLEQHLSPFPLITPVLWALSLQSQMTMTLSDTTIKIALRDLCQGWGIGNDRGLFEFFSFLDLKIKELKRMETANWKMLAGFLPWAGMCLLLFFCLLLQWDLPSRNVLSPFCPRIMGALSSKRSVIYLCIPQSLSVRQFCFRRKKRSSTP